MVKHKFNVADAITASRIAFAILILFCSAFSIQFYAFYLLGAFSDMIDGTVARKLNLKSSFGAKLDTVADCVFVATVLVKVLLAISVPKWLWIWIAIIAFIKFTNLVLSFVVQRRMVSMHTVMNKITGFMLFLLPFSIGSGSWQTFAKVSVIIVCSVATFSAVQEGYFICSKKEIE